MITVKCDICEKIFTVKEDKEQFIVCEDCRNALRSDAEGKGDDE